MEAGQGVPRLSPCLVSQLAQLVSAGVGGQVRAAKMVAQQVRQAVCACPIAVAHCNPLSAGIIVFGHRLRAAVPLEVVPHVGASQVSPKI